MRSDQAGMTLVELLVMVCIVCVLLVIGSFQLLRARAHGFEASAVASLRVIAQGEVVYSIACGYGGFAPSLMILGRPVAGRGTPFVPPDLTAATTTLKSGYYFTVRSAHDSVAYKTDCNGTRNVTAYYASARPVSYGLAGGTQSFAVSLNGVVWALNAPTPPPEPFGPPAVPYR